MSQMCDSCLQKSTDTSEKLARVRSILKDMKDRVQRLQGRSREENAPLLDFAELKEIEKISDTLEDSDDDREGSGEISSARSDECRK